MPDNLEGYDALIITGGHGHIYDEEQHPHLKQEKRLTQLALKKHVPFLGVCLGCQLLASVLGATVKPYSPLRVGFISVQLTDEGQFDPFYHGLHKEHFAFQWHDDLIELPSESVLLATTPEQEIMAFRYGWVTILRLYSCL